VHATFLTLFGKRVGRNRFIAQLVHSRSRFFGRDRNSRLLAGNVQQVMSGERRNKAIARLRAQPILAR